MTDWRKVLTHTATDVENAFDEFKYRLHDRLGHRDPTMIYPYRGFGNQQRLYIKGRVLEDKGIRPPSDNDSIWENLLNMYRRFESDEVPHARVRVRCQGFEKEITADEEGYFETWVEPTNPIPEDVTWQPVELELVAPIQEGNPPVQAEGQALIPPNSAKFGVISDIDDTVLQTDAAHMLRLARNVFLGNARTRLPFKGVAAFYRALFEGSSGSEKNPLFYVSSSPWNLYDLLSDFFQLQEIPFGPVLFLRDFGLSEEGFLPTKHREYKLQAIRRALDLYQDLHFLLIGDSGQEDPEIYSELVTLYPQRILAIYIRNVSRNLKRPEAIRKLADKVRVAGSTLILADDTVPMAEHAAEQGWISPSALPDIRQEKKKDEAPPSLVEKALGVEEPSKEEAPTIVVDGKDSKKVNSEQ